MNDVVDAITDKAIEKSIEEILVDRCGKNKTMEVYSSSSEFLMMFENGYSLLARMKTPEAKRVSVEVYLGLGDVTSGYFKSPRAARRAKKPIVEALVARLERLPKVEVEDLDEI